MLVKQIETDHCRIEIHDDYVEEGCKKQDILERLAKILTMTDSRTDPVRKPEERL